MSALLGFTRGGLGRAVLALWGIGAWGCSVTALEERERAIAINECAADAQCGVNQSAHEGRAGTGHCVSRTCVANEGELATLLFELTPTATGNALAGVSFFELKNVSGQSPSAVDLRFEAAVPLKGSVIPEPRPEACASRFIVPGAPGPLPVARDDSIPARVSFTPALEGSGLSVSSRSSEAQPNRDLSLTNPIPRSYVFSPSLPAGTYDVQIEPFAQVEPVGEGCRYPPQLIRGFCIQARPNLALTLPVPLPSQLKLSITHRDSQPLANGWMVDMVDSLTGKLISTRVPLALPSTAGGVAAYSVVLDYLPVIEHSDCERTESPSSSELVRLSPPAGAVAPMMLFERSALELFSPGAGRIEQLPRLPNPVLVEGHVVSASAKRPEAATLTFVGRSLQGVPAGVLASFTRTVETTEEGEFEIELLPGIYDVHAAPSTTDATAPLRISREIGWEIAPTPARQAGRAIELKDALSLGGAALVPVGGGGGARGASVVVEASAAFLAESSLLSRALDGVQPGPRSATTVISGPSGEFTLSTDAGRFDLSVRPPEGSGFAWLVMPDLELADSSGFELPGLELPLPVIVNVHATINGESDGATVGARVRAFVATDAKGQFTADPKGAIFLPVAEGRIEDGVAQLMVPAFLHEPRP